MSDTNELQTEKEKKLLSFLKDHPGSKATQIPHNLRSLLRELERKGKIVYRAKGTWWLSWDQG